MTYATMWAVGAISRDRATANVFCLPRITRRLPSSMRPPDAIYNGKPYQANCVKVCNNNKSNCLHNDTKTALPLTGEEHSYDVYQSSFWKTHQKRITHYAKHNIKVINVSYKPYNAELNFAQSICEQLCNTSSSAIAEKPRCSVGQLWRKYQCCFLYSKNIAVDCCCS